MALTPNGKDDFTFKSQSSLARYRTTYFTGEMKVSNVYECKLKLNNVYNFKHFIADVGNEATCKSQIRVTKPTTCLLKIRI